MQNKLGTIKMRLLSTIFFSFLLVSCDSPDRGSLKSECTEFLKLSMDKTMKLAKKLPGDVGKSMIADMKKKENQDDIMKVCMAATPERRAKERKKLEAL